MIIVGAGGHAKEIYDIVYNSNEKENLHFFEEPQYHTNDDFFNPLSVIHSYEIIKNILEEDNRFILAVGNPHLRKKFNEIFSGLGGKLVSAISSQSVISSNNVNLGDGLNIMNYVFISPSVKIGDGTLVNARSNIHHDVTIGQHCEINPGVMLLGHAEVGDLCSIGTSAVILPYKKIGKNSIIGAGAVVTKDIPENSIAYGIPARLIKRNSNTI